MQDFPHDCGMVDTYVNALLILYSNSIILFILSNASYVGRLRFTDIGDGYSFLMAFNVHFIGWGTSIEGHSRVVIRRCFGKHIIVIDEYNQMNMCTSVPRNT